MAHPPALLELRRTERYLVHDAIATGGMASVHVGVLEGALGFSRVVAVKRLHPQLAADARFVAMLIEEARLVSRIRHVNVVPTFDILEVDGEVFVIMEYVRGASLARLVDLTQARGELVPLRLALPILVGTLRGLDAAHEATDAEGRPLGIVHRDVSPQNVLVGTGGIARIIDFGVARALGRSDPTRTGEFKGKLSYAAPEQLGDGTATRRTDVYAVGIMLWELLTGQRLFKADTDVETFKKAMTARVASPLDVYAEDERMRAARTAREVEAVAPVALRALERDPSVRFATAAEMAQALEASLVGAPLSEIGAWVQSVARAELAHEQAIVARAEEEVAKRARRSLPSAPGLGGPTSSPELVVVPRPAAPGAPPPPAAAATRHFLIGLPPTTLLALALSAAAGAGLGTVFFSSWLGR